MRQALNKSIYFKDSNISLAHMMRAYRREQNSFSVDILLNPAYTYFIHANSVGGVKLNVGILHPDNFRVSIYDRDVKIIRVDNTDYPNFNPAYASGNKFNFQTLRIAENARKFTSIFWESDTSLDETPSYNTWYKLDEDLVHTDNYIQSKIDGDPIIEELYNCGCLDIDTLDACYGVCFQPVTGEDVLKYTPSRIFDISKITAVVVYNDPVNNPSTVISFTSLNKLLVDDGNGWFNDVKYIVIKNSIRGIKVLFSNVGIKTPLDVIDKFHIEGAYKIIRITDDEIREKANLEFKDVIAIEESAVTDFIHGLKDIKDLDLKDRDETLYLLEFDDGFAAEAISCYYYGIEGFAPAILEHISYTDYDSTNTEGNEGFRKLVHHADREVG